MKYLECVIGTKCFIISDIYQKKKKKNLYCYLVTARDSLIVATSRGTIFVSAQKIWLRENVCAWEKLFNINYSIRL